MDNIKIGLFLQALRKAKGYTQQELAEYLNLSNKTISKWECGQAIPDISTLLVLAEFYEVSVDEILNGARKEAKEVKTTKIRDEYVKNKVYRKYLVFEIVSLGLLGITLIFSLFACFGFCKVPFVIVCAFTLFIALTVNLSQYLFYDYKTELEFNDNLYYKKYKMIQMIFFSSFAFVSFMYFAVCWYSTNVFSNLILIGFSLILGGITFLLLYKENKKGSGVILMINKVLIATIIVSAIYFIVINLYLPVIIYLDSAVENSKVYLYEAKQFVYGTFALAIVSILSLFFKKFRKMIIGIVSILFGILLIYSISTITKLEGTYLYYQGSYGYGVFFIVLGIVNSILGFINRRKISTKRFIVYENDQKGKIIFFILSPLMIIANALYLHFANVFKVTTGTGAHYLYDVYYFFDNKLLYTLGFCFLAVVIFGCYFIKKFRGFFYIILNISAIVVFCVLLSSAMDILYERTNSVVTEYSFYIEQASFWHIAFIGILIVLTIMWPCLYTRIKINKKNNDEQ